MSREPFAIVITEWRNNLSGQKIREALVTCGFNVSVAARGPKNNSARGSIASELVTPKKAVAGDLVLATLERVVILGCYFPQGNAKSIFFEQCAEVATTAQAPLLIIGDFNTGRNDLDIEGNGVPFDCADLFVGLSDRAVLTDLWRSRQGDRREWTWRSAKSGFRIDHALANQALIDRFPDYRCEINHEPLLLGLTDHSAILVDLA